MARALGGGLRDLGREDVTTTSFAMFAASEVGFYGKLPSHGDFLRRRVSDAFIGVWDAWLQECLTASRGALGDRWLDVYLTSPAWRFACAPGACGAGPIAGLMVPSVDRVGRYFPLTVAAELPHAVNPLIAARLLEPFYDAAERLVIETLAAERVDFESFDEHVAKLTAHLASLGPADRLVIEPQGAAILNGVAAWQLPLGAAARLEPVFEQVLAQQLGALYDPLALWWTSGSAIVEPSCLITNGLPHPDSFAGLLDGSWTAHRWRSVPVQITGAVARPDDALIEDATPPRFRSAGDTNVGCVRSVNQDAFIERTDVGVWAVADGLGGHRDGEIASRMVCDALAEVVPDSSFEDAVKGVCCRLTEVNEHLVRAAERTPDGVGSGSTVVALLMRGTRCAILWAGDSRVYRWRGGRLEQLTRDHSLAEADGKESTAITRAIGGEPTLVIDVVRDRVRAGDRFLLCSDGLTRPLPETVLQQWIEHGDIGEGVAGLIEATLQAGAPDNVTAVIVEAYA
jgi:type VI secretion system protein ImpM